MIFGRREQNDCGGWALQELFIFIFILHINTCCVALMILAEDNRMIVVGLARSCVVVLLLCCCVLCCTDDFWQKTTERLWWALQEGRNGPWERSEGQISHF